MAPLRTFHRQRNRLAAVALAGLLLSSAAACSSSGDGAADGTTTTSSTVTGGTGTTSGPATSSTATTVDGESDVTSPSTLPSYDGPCAALADTYGLDQVQPRNSDSWVDERQRIVVDAQREAALLGQAQRGAPAQIAAQLATMQAYASWIATTVEGADSYSAAVSAIGGYPDQVGVSLAIASVGTWQRDSCPR